MKAITFQSVSKKFRLKDDRVRSIRSVVIDQFRGGRRPPELWALRDVTFAVEAGETIGIIGDNGSGKSTLLKLIARIVEPTAGRVTRSGSIAALLELGAGFHPDYTGRENIYLFGSFHGMTRRDMNASIDGIVEFSELAHFIDQPVKHYSSGMYLRLAFSVAVALNPDVFLLDEILAVGDEHFKNKCLQRMDELQRMGKTLVIVSHNLENISSLCQRALWIRHGQLVLDARADEVVERYLTYVSTLESVTAADDSGALLHTL